VAYGNISAKAWHIERDRIEIRIGASSADIRLKHTLEVK